MKSQTRLYVSLLLFVAVLGSVAQSPTFAGGVAPIVVDADLGVRTKLERPITHQFQVSQGTPPITWSDLTITPPLHPIIPQPELTSSGEFRWFHTNALAGEYVFQVTATNSFGSDLGTLTFDLIYVPEPSTWLLLSGAVAGLSIRRRSRNPA